MESNLPVFRLGLFDDRHLLCGAKTLYIDHASKPDPDREPLLYLFCRRTGAYPIGLTGGTLAVLAQPGTWLMALSLVSPGKNSKV